MAFVPSPTTQTQRSIANPWGVVVAAASSLIHFSGKLRQFSSPNDSPLLSRLSLQLGSSSIDTTGTSNLFSELPANDTIVGSSMEEASQILFQWDRLCNPDSLKSSSSSSSLEWMDHTSMEDLFIQLEPAVLFLNARAREERNSPGRNGQCKLGICAPSALQGIQTLKNWVTALQLPRGLLHGMDRDGVPVDIDGPVFIKYNSGGVYTFSDIRKSGLGFDALWKPGDALLEPYENGSKYQGVYFQVELSDGEFRQYLLPLDLFS